jgi:hypothetical protein
MLFLQVTHIFLILLFTGAIDYVRFQIFNGGLQFQQRLKRDRVAFQTQLTAAVEGYHNNTDPQSADEFPFLQTFIPAMEHFGEMVTGQHRTFGNLLYGVLYLFPWLHHIQPHDHSKPVDGLLDHAIMTLVTGNQDSPFLPYEFKLELKKNAASDPLQLGPNPLKVKLPDNSIIYMDGLPVQQFYSHSLYGLGDKRNCEAANARAAIVCQRLHDRKLKQ